MPRHQTAVDGIPVNFIAVPVFVFMLSEEHGHYRHILFRCGHKHTVVFHEPEVRSWYRDFPVAPKARNHKSRPHESGGLLHCLVEESRVHNLECVDMRLVEVFALRHLHIRCPGNAFS